MNTYTFEIKIEAEKPEEAKMKMAAISIMASKLRAHELHRLAQVVDKEPAKMLLARKYLGL